MNRHWHRCSKNFPTIFNVTHRKQSRGVQKAYRLFPLQRRRNSPGCPGNGLGTFPTTPFCACAVSDTTVRLCTGDVEVLICVNSSLPANHWKTTQAGSFQLSKERIRETSCGKAKFQEAWFAKLTWRCTAGKVMIVSFVIRVRKRSRNWRCVQKVQKTRLWPGGFRVGS